MARLTAEEQAAKWATRLGAATQDVINGVQRVTEAPGQKAARQKAVWLARIQERADKWEANVGRVTLQDWQAATVAGAQRIASGAQAKKGKMETFLRDFIPFQEQVTARVKQMPRGNLEQNLARMVEQARLTAGYKRPGR